MKPNKFLYILIGILVILNLSTLGFMWSAKKGGRFLDRNDRPHRPEVFFKRKLDLNKKQVLQFEKAREMHFQKIEELRHEIGDLRKQLNDSMRKEKGENAKSIIDAIGDKHKEIEMLNYNHFNELRSYCTNEQKKTFDSIFTRMTDRPQRRLRGPH